MSIQIKNGLPYIDPAELRHKVTILQQVDTTDASGAAVTWTPFIQTRAAIEPASAKDVIKTGQQVSQVEVPITIRWRSGVKANMHLQTASNTYVIQGITNYLERNILLTLACVALGPNE